MKRTNFILVALLAIFMASCSVPKEITYFQDVEPGTDLTVAKPYQIKIQKSDKLRIYVSTQDQRLTEMFNIVTGYGLTNASNSSTIFGYVVDPSGDIDFPLIGKIKAEGKTRAEVAETIKQEIQKRDLVKDPVVTVDFLNLGVSVLGDVARPGHFSILNDRYTILEAIADAGDLTITAKRENIKVIRQEPGEQKVYFVDLTDAKSLTDSPVFYLQQNDVIYVEPNDKRKREATALGNTMLQYGFWMSLISTMLSLGVLLKK